MLQIRWRKDADILLDRWQAYFGLDDWVIDTERISIYQVSDEFCRVGHEFVGVSQDLTQKHATIHHTRKLLEDDIIHELLHVRYPNWSEEEVVHQTEVLMRRRKREHEILQREAQEVC